MCEHRPNKKLQKEKKLRKYSAKARYNENLLQGREMWFMPVAETAVKTEKQKEHPEWEP